MKSVYDEIFTLVEDYKYSRMGSAGDCLALSGGFALKKRRSPNRQHFEFNVLDCMGTSEPDISKILTALFRYKDREGKHVVLNDFVSRFLPSVDSADFSGSRIDAEQEKIDLSVRGREHCIIIENKVRNAVFQRNQLGRYLMKARQWGYDDRHVHLVILPQYPMDVAMIRHSVWCAPTDWRKPNGERACGCCDAYHCRCDHEGWEKDSRCVGCLDFFPDYKDRTVIICSEMVHWLSGVVKSLDFSTEPSLLGTLLILVDWLKNTYGTNKNHKIQKEMERYLSDKLFGQDAETMPEIEKFKIIRQKVREVNDLNNALIKMRDDLTDAMFRQWKMEMRQFLEKRNLHPSALLADDASSWRSFGIQLKAGIRIGIWYKPQDQPFFWGTWADGNWSEEMKIMSRRLVETSELKALRHEGEWWDWNWTMSGPERLQSLIDAAISLDYLP